MLTMITGQTNEHIIVTHTLCALAHMAYTLCAHKCMSGCLPLPCPCLALMQIIHFMAANCRFQIADWGLSSKCSLFGWTNISHLTRTPTRTGSQTLETRKRLWFRNYPGQDPNDVGRCCCSLSKGWPGNMRNMRNTTTTNKGRAGQRLQPEVRKQESWEARKLFPITRNQFAS